MPNKIKLAVAMPTWGMNDSRTTYSLMLLMLHFAKGIRSRPEVDELDVVPMLQMSSTIHANRERIVADCRAGGCTHLLFVDHDMEFEPRAVELLFSRRMPIVATSYAIKVFPVNMTAVGLDGNRVTTKEESTGLEEIIYTGFGLSLFDLSVFDGVPQPWFCPVWDDRTKSYTTEDLPCYETLRRAGHHVWLDHDASKLVNHHGDFSYHWKHALARKEA